MGLFELEDKQKPTTNSTSLAEYEPPALEYEFQLHVARFSFFRFFTRSLWVSLCSTNIFLVLPCSVLPIGYDLAHPMLHQYKRKNTVQPTHISVISTTRTRVHIKRGQYVVDRIVNYWTLLLLHSSFFLSHSFTKHASHSVLLLSALFATALQLLSLDSSPKSPLNPLQAEIQQDRSVVRARYFSIFLRIFLLTLCRSFLCLLSFPYIIYRWIIVIICVSCITKSQSLFASLFLLVIVLVNVNVVVVLLLLLLLLSSVSL